MNRRHIDWKQYEEVKGIIPLESLAADTEQYLFGNVLDWLRDHFGQSKTSLWDLATFLVGEYAVKYHLADHLAVAEARRLDDERCAKLKNGEYEKLYGRIDDVIRDTEDWIARQDSINDNDGAKLIEELKEDLHFLKDTSHRLEEHLAWDEDN